jgi:hypothetical protein
VATMYLTARDVVLESMKFIRGELEFFSGYDYVKQDNHNETVYDHSTGKVILKPQPKQPVVDSTLSEFF